MSIIEDLNCGHGFSLHVARIQPTKLGWPQSLSVVLACAAQGDVMEFDIIDKLVG